MLRTMMFRNFRNPFFNSKKGDIRLDLYHLMRLVSVVSPDAFVWPSQDDGKLSMRLEHLCAANGIVMRAHDAFEDAFATKELFALLRERAPWAVDLALECGNKARMEEKLAQARKDGRVLVSFTHFGKPDFAPVVPLAADARRCILFDLRSAENPDAAAAADPKILYNGESPYRLLNTNKFPLLLDEAQYEGLTGETLPDYVSQKALQINGDEALSRQFKDVMSSGQATKVNEQSNEEAIYSGFLKPRDNAQMSRFISARNWSERALVSFDDPRLRDFSARILIEGFRNGDAAFPPNVLQGLAMDCSEAFSRPFSRPNERYSTLEGCAPTAEASWISWARRTYGEHPALVEDMPETFSPARSQLSFEF
jgi:exodeoxyribonuclease-1